MDYDVVIIGLGPAGSTLARQLAPNLKILALDKKMAQGDQGFHKPCGGLLATDAQRAFVRFNLNFPKDILTNPQIFSVKTFDLQTQLIRNYQRTYINFDRHQFDLWLKSLIPESVEVHHASLCKEIIKIEDGYQIIFKTANNEARSVTTRYLVGADGAHSLVRRTFYPNHNLREYVAIQQWFEEKHPVPFYSCIFDNQLTDCYAWSISKDDYFIFGGAFPKKSANERFEALKIKLSKQFSFIFDKSLKSEKCLVVYPERFKDFLLGDNQLFLIGEAAGLISASSLEGISYALDSAEQLSRILNCGKGDLNALYKRSMLPLKIKLWTKIWKSKILTTPFLRKWLMKSRISHINQQ